MKRYVNYLMAVAKIGYDKTTDKINYLTNNENNNNENDTVKEYKDILKIQNYTDEKKNKRILEDVGFLTEHISFLKSPSLIIDNIYIGSAFNAASYYDLKELGITLIINVTKEIRNFYPNDFEYINCPIYDDNKNKILPYLKDVYNKILDYRKNKKGSILVHCYMGASRSVSLVIYYIMNQLRDENGGAYSFDDALEYIKKKRPVANPTFRFTKDLAKSCTIDIKK